jgi:hypothetical protein
MPGHATDKSLEEHLHHPPRASIWREGTAMFYVYFREGPATDEHGLVHCDDEQQVRTFITDRMRILGGEFRDENYEVIYGHTCNLDVKTGQTVITITKETD